MTVFHDTPLPEELTTEEFCELVRIGRSTAERWRLIGGKEYPPFTKHPGKRGKVTYNREVVLAWLASRRRTSTSDPGSGT